VFLSRLKGDGKAVGLNVDEVALKVVSEDHMMELPDGMLTLASPVWQQAATLEPQACWMGTATVSLVSLAPECCQWKCRRTDGDAEAVEADEVLAAVAAGELLAVTALGLVALRVDLDLLVVVGSTALGGSEGNGSHGGDEERLEEGHFEGVGLV
jgi:hypothetical protein